MTEPIEERPGGSNRLKNALARWADRDRLMIGLTVFLLAFLRVLPALRHFLYNLDEGITFSVGASIVHGGLPYVDSICQRGPLLHATAAAVYALFGGFNLVAWNMTGVAFFVLTTAMIRVVGGMLYGRHAANLAPLLFTIFGSLGLIILDTHGLNGEIFGNLPALVGLYFLIHASRTGKLSPYFWAGFFVMIGALYKQVIALQSILIAMTALLAFVREKNEPSAFGRFVRRGIAALAGFALPMAVVLAIYARAGHLKEFWFWFYQYNAMYARAGREYFPLANYLTWYGMVVLMRVVPLTIGCLAVFRTVLRVRTSENLREREPELLGASWVLLTLISVVLGFRNFGYYFMQALPAMAVVGAHGLLVPQDQPVKPVFILVWLRRLTVAFLMASMAVLMAINFLVFLNHSLGALSPKTDPVRNNSTIKLGEWVAKETKPTDKIFIWGFHPRLYPFSGRMSASRFTSALYLTGQYGGLWFDPKQFDLRKTILPGVWKQFIDDLNANQPAVIVDGSMERFSLFSMLPISLFPLLENAVKSNYVRREDVAGFAVYVRKADQDWRKVPYLKRYEYSPPKADTEKAGAGPLFE